MKHLVKVFFFHLFPFGWIFSIGGLFLFWSSIVTILPILFYGISVSEGKIEKITNFRSNEYGDGGNNCYVTVIIRVKSGKIYGCSESCDNINDFDVGKATKIKYIKIPSNNFSITNKILSIENKSINHYLGQSELMTIILFLWGAGFLYIAYRNIKYEYKRQVKKEEKRKNQPPSSCA